LPAGYAARYPSVLAVAASAAQRNRAFYSNRGTLAAPGGGDNRPACAPGQDLPGPRDCWASPDYWLISAGVHRHPQTGAEYFSYATWVGTSFAAPLVSGMAALALPAAGNGPDTADQVRDQVCAPATDPEGDLGEGIAGFCP
jgi:subtilisin family serine protease